MSERFGSKTAACRVPDSRAAISANGGEELSVGTPLDRPNPSRMPHRSCKDSASSSVPDSHDARVRACGNGLAVRPKRGPKHRTIVSYRLEQRLSGSRVPKAGGAVRRGRDKYAAIRTEGRHPASALVL